jgi:DNA-binding response OmpR family regulator
MKILVIEDEPGMRDNIVQSLQKEMYIVETAEDYFSAREKLGVYDYDCVLLDIGLPGGSGLDILKELKKEGKEWGIIIVSAKDSIDDKVNGLDLGADDYLPKPFHMSELHARVKSIIRRKNMSGSATITVNNVSIDAEQRIAAVNGKRWS